MTHRSHWADAWLQVAEGIKPTLTELEKFEDHPEGMEVDSILVRQKMCDEPKKNDPPEM